MLREQKHPVIRETQSIMTPACESCRYWSEEPMGGEDTGVCTKFSVPAVDKYLFTYYNETCDSHEHTGHNG